MAKTNKKLSFGSRIKRFFGGNDVEETKADILDIHQKSGAFMVDTPFMFDGFAADMLRRKSYYDRIDLAANDGIIESAVKLLVTAALGGHETSGDVVFIEKKPGITPQQEKIIEEMAVELLPYINRLPAKLKKQ